MLIPSNRLLQYITDTYGFRSIETANKDFYIVELLRM